MKRATAHVSPEDVRRRMEKFKEVCSNATVKVTHQRLEIFREVAKTGEHPDAETVFRGVRERIPTVSLDTVYRTLWLLIDLGLVGTLGVPRQRLRFEANMSRHHHFVCRRCGMARDFYSQEFDRLKVPDGVKPLGDAETTHVEIRGICSRCSSQKRGKRHNRA